MDDSLSAADANRYRIQRLERDVHDIQVKLDDYTALKRDVASLANEVKELSGEFAGLRRALAVTSFTVAGSAVMFAVSVLVAIVQ